MSVGKTDRLAGERDIGVFEVTMHGPPCTLDKQEDNQETESSALNSVFFTSLWQDWGTYSPVWNHHNTVEKRFNNIHLENNQKETTPKTLLDAK